MNRIPTVGGPSTAKEQRPRRARWVAAAGLGLSAAVMQASPASAASTVGGMWTFDEPAGSSVAADSSGNGNDGNLRGGVVAGQPGVSGSAFSFEDPGSWVEVASTPTLNPGPRDFSYSTYVNLSVAPASGVTYDLIRKGLTSTAGGEFKLEVVAGGKVKCTAKDSSKVVASITGAKTRVVTDGRWHRVGCSRTGSTWRVTIDDYSKSKTVTLGSISNTRSLSLGSKYGQEDATPGLLDQVELTIVEPDEPTP